MAKIFGLFGSMTGKLADTVMSVRNGEQIARKYQPVVYNPSTPAQVATRAKMKLMSQLSAVLAPAIAIERIGSVSSRNLFTKRNYQFATFENNQADITLTSVQLTNSAVGMPLIAAARTENAIRVLVDQSSSIAFGNLDADEVIYALVSKGLDTKLRLVDVKKVTKEESATFETTFPIVATECVVYAYAIRYNSETARATYGDVTATPAETIAKLLVSRAISSADVTVSETVAATLAALASAQNAAAPDSDTRKKKE